MAADTSLLGRIRSLDYVRSAQSWRGDLDRADRYYRGEQPLAFMSDAMRQEFGETITALVLNWPELGADAYENRLDVEGFRFPGQPSGDSGLWDVWQANNMDGKSIMGHLDAVALGKSAVIVGAPDSAGDPPVVTVESALDVAWRRDPKSGLVREASKSWAEDDGSQWKTVYDGGSTKTVTFLRGQWVVTEDDRHDMGAVPVVPLVNRPRIKYPDGRSEFWSIIPIADAANKMATDMMVSGEYHAMPRRWAFGLKRADFLNPDGTAKSTWSVIKGRLWANENSEVKVGQFPEADLKNFHETVKLLAQLASQILALPPHYMGFATVNPPSADAIRSSEAQMVKRSERKHVYFGESWEEAMRLVLRIMEGDWRPEARSLETVWRNPATPTVAQQADAAVKLVTARGADGRALVPTEQARIDLGYNPAQRAEMAKMDADTATSDPILAMGRDLMGGTGNAPAPVGR